MGVGVGRGVERITGEPWSQPSSLLYSLTPQLFSFSPILEKAPILPAMSWEAPHHCGGPKAFILQPGGSSAESPRDLFTLFLGGHFLVFRLVQLVLERCIQVQACSELLRARASPIQALEQVRRPAY